MVMKLSSHREIFLGFFSLPNSDIFNLRNFNKYGTRRRPITANVDSLTTANSNRVLPKRVQHVPSIMTSEKMMSTSMTSDKTSNMTSNMTSEIMMPSSLTSDTTSEKRCRLK
jgi:small-conductance mechanosensitive channel